MAAAMDASMMQQMQSDIEALASRLALSDANNERLVRVLDQVRAESLAKV